ncbi:unnamed protein product [Dicrocoelium dendriticum]|nr:unnamed protein product [Dicrocoelium dendriticum]
MTYLKAEPHSFWGHLSRTSICFRDPLDLEMSPSVGYWKIRGLAQSIRLLLEYIGEEFDDIQYECGPAPEYSRKDWEDVKPNMGLDFPNLPYYKDDDVNLTQTAAILAYVAEKHNIGGSTPKDRAVLAMINGAVSDVRMAYVRLCYSSDFEKLRPGFVSDLPHLLKPFDEYLKTRSWISGDQLSYPDFNFYDLLDCLKTLEPNCLNAFPRLQQYITKFEALPQIAAYMQSPRFLKWPMNNKMASWGGDK